MSEVWNNPEMLDVWKSGLQWLAIVLVLLAGLIQVATLVLGNREKALSAVLDSAGQLQRRAQQGSWPAYQELLGLANTPGPFQDTVKRRVELIQKETLVYRDIPASRTDLNYIVSGKSVRLPRLSVVEMFQLLARPSSSVLMRQSLMTYILEKPRQDVLIACHSVLVSSDSLPARAAACGILARVLGTRAEFLDCENWAKICQDEIESSQRPTERDK